MQAGLGRAVDQCGSIGGQVPESARKHCQAPLHKIRGGGRMGCGVGPHKLGEVHTLEEAQRLQEVQRLEEEERLEQEQRTYFGHEVQGLQEP